MLKRIKGFTAIELMIVVAIILILVVLAASAFQRDAGAHEVAPDHAALKTYLAEIGADYRWGGYSDSHVLVIIRRGTAKWTSVEDACTALISRDSTLSGTQLILQDGKSGTAELRWERSGESRVLTNMPSTDVAICT